MSEVSTDMVKTVYEQICTAHNGISDFRAKLLALLPIASGTGIFLLLSDKITPELRPHLAAIGIFGALTTLGLFLYELRGIHRCGALIECGKIFERELPKSINTGTYKSEQKGVLKGFVSITWAALLIYPTIIGTWSYVACVGMEGYGFDNLEALKISGAITLFFVFTGKIVNNLQRRQIAEFVKQLNISNKGTCNDDVVVSEFEGKMQASKQA